MKKFGLIGDPVRGSKSPALFTAGYGSKYVYDLIEGSDFEASYRKFLDSYDGINVTAPFKEPAFRRADVREQMCGKIGATNLLVKTEEGIKAYNSDYYGIILCILEAVSRAFEGESTETVWLSSPRPDGQRCREILSGRIRTALVTGCGGAGKAAAVAAGTLGLETVLMNRTMSKAEEIASDLPEYGFTPRPIGDFTECFRTADLVIYTLPAPLPDLERLRAEDAPGKKIILEANYRNPSFTAGVLERISAGNPGVSYVPGIKWLLYQAYSGYDLFTGESPDMKKMLASI